MNFNRLNIIIYTYYIRRNKLKFILTHLYSKSFYFENDNNDINNVFKYKNLIVRVIIIVLLFSLYEIQVNIITN